ncbi:RNA-binding protein with serine-rich domain 1-like [Phyllopteryx taeniolatus]|uniref:RNA-binding protein with serine-rich domain 1-like n=1 Tax=Phyllopteryx taeniolatus TaxID=161469 RepID=UPI002AD3D9A3|nr:RNA-binding protein with serine-rich domain 1-like [Phyllopteryx taeniolatus]
MLCRLLLVAVLLPAASCETWASSLTKKEDDKSKQGLKQKSGALKVWPEKDQGGVKNQTQRSASSGSSSSSSSSGSGSSSSSSASSSSSSRSSSSSSSTSPSPTRQRHNRQRSSSKSKLAKKDDRERRRRSPAPKPTKVYLGRLTRNVIKEHIQEIFSTYGKIKMIDMPMNHVHPHLSKGYAYIEFETPEEAEKALKHMDGGQIDGQEITVIAVLTPTMRAPPRRLSPPCRMPPPPLMWRRSPPRMRRRSPRRRSPVRRRS